MDLNDHSDDRITFLQLHLGGDRNFCYLLGDAETGESAVVDPGFEPGRLAGFAAERRMRITEILITHGHPDHCGGAAELAALTGARVRAGAGENVSGAVALKDDERLSLGRLGRLDGDLGAGLNGQGYTG